MSSRPVAQPVYQLGAGVKEAAMTGLYVLARFGVIDSIHRQAAPAVCQNDEISEKVDRYGANDDNL